MNKRLLLITQKVDSTDPVLGFFHEWIVAFAKQCESVIVICLEKGRYEFPKNVVVLSLGKEDNRSRLTYLYRFYTYILKYRRNYNSVFVHMNSEYMLLAGWLWRLMHKKILLWRNHVAGNWKARFAVMLAHQVFCTSPTSYTARFKKTKIMPVGIDEKRFAVQPVERKYNAILYVGRISPVKNIECLIEAVALVATRGFSPTLDIYGPVLDHSYYESLLKRIAAHNLKDHIQFRGSVTQDELQEIYSRYGICVNMTNSGSFDKTVIESVFCEAFPVVSNESFITQYDQSLRKYIAFQENNAESLAKTLTVVLSLSLSDKKSIANTIAGIAKKRHSLTELLQQLINFL